MTTRPRIVILIGSLLVLFVLLASLSRVLTDWFWFQSIDYPQLLLTPLLMQLAVGVGTGVVAGLVFSGNMLLARRFTPTVSRIFTLPRTSAAQPVWRFDAVRLVRRLALPVALVLGIGTGAFAAVQWETVLLALHATPFGEVDPLLSRDLGFYVFQLPLLELVYELAAAILVQSIIATLLAYLAFGVLQLRHGLGRFLRSGLQPVLQGVRRHLSFLFGVAFLLVGLRTWSVHIPSLLTSATGPFIGASYTDIHVSLPVLTFGTWLALLVALTFFVNVVRPIARIVTVGVVLYFLTVPIGRWVGSEAMQRLIVQPNEFAKETPYLSAHIDATRRAYGIEDVRERDLSGEASLTLDDIERNQATIQNVRLWDRQPLLDTFGQLQEIRTYYDFVSVDNDRYVIDGAKRQVLLSPRELSSANLPQRNFINERLTFTHGYGLTLSPVNEVTAEGLPVLFVQNLPPVSNVDGIHVTRPAIYYGERVNDFVIVNTRAKEFDYPAGEDNVFTTYDAESGVPVGSFLRKLLFSMRFQTAKLFLSNDVTRDSQVLFYRNIRERIRRTVPFLHLDRDPYLVIRDDGSLAWIVDAYTTSDRYPYAARVSDARLRMSGADGVFANGRLNYIRNSVKIVVDAYTGDLTYYIADPSDPIIQTYAKIFPDTFTTLDTMPDDLRAHVRYPEDLFAFQTDAYSVYHMDEPQIFYNREDQWAIPTSSSDDAEDPMLRHLIMQLPDEEDAEFILMLPYTPRGKDNLAAWMVARNDGDAYGELVVYRFPKQTLVFGPQQIINRINQDPDISRQVTLWDQRGSSVIRGNLLVIPIEESLLYVQPIYLRAEGGRIPELKRVIVAYEQRIAMAETLDAAFQQLFIGESTPKTPDDAIDEVPQVDTGNGDDLAVQARDAYERALEAQRAGDWTTYGEQIERLGQLLGQLAE